MSVPETRPSDSNPLTLLNKVWHVTLAIVRGLVVMSLVAVVIDGLWGGDSGLAGRFNALFIIVLSCVSLAYWLYVSSKVHMHLPEIEAQVTEVVGDEAHQGVANLWHKVVERLAEKSGAGVQRDATTTIQVSRLSSEAARVAIVNDALLPVLRAKTTLRLALETKAGEIPSEMDSEQVKGTDISIPARSVQATTVSNAFDHVGVFWLFFGGVRVYGLLGMLSGLCGTPGRWRVRVVPNVYRLPFGIPNDRKLMQDSLGVPDSPADALDYDRVRDYQPGDPLKTIHWKLVAHGQGELYTKLFEASTVSMVTLVIDPHGADAQSALRDAACHMYDTMLEGGFSLIEHARQNGFGCSLRFVDRAGSLIEASWAGPGVLGWFVETAGRPSGAQKALSQSVASIRSLRDARTGYVIFATSGLTASKVEELILSHNADVPLLVVHALPAHTQSERARQGDFDMRLRAASIDVIELDDGPQIVREVIPHDIRSPR